MNESTSLFAGMGMFVLIYLVVMVLIVVVVLTSLWRGMRAQERMERHLAAIAATLEQRGQL